MGFIRSSLLGVCLAAAVAAGCNSEGMSGSPSSPSPGGTTAGGATITGRVTGATATASAADTFGPTAASPLTITVVGTGISTVTDSAGTFTLNGVPSGTVQLSLTGPGINATVTIDGVQDGQQIQVSISVANGRAHLDSEDRSRGVDVNGRIAELNAAARTFRVGSTLVRVPATATIRHGSRTLTFANLAIGDHVEVKGAMDGTTLVATEVKVEQEGEDDDDDDENEVEGAVAGLTGNCPSLAFTVQAVRVTTSSATRFEGSCNRIQNGTRVEAEGRRQADGSLAATKVEVDRD